MLEPRTRDGLVRAGLLALLLAVGVVSFDRAVRGRFDFHHFYIDARYVWEHGALNPEIAQPATDETRNLPFYLPVVPLALSPLTAGGRLPAALVWSVAQVLALGYSLSALARWARGSDEHAAIRWQLFARKAGNLPLAFIVAVVLALPAIYEAARFNQLSFFVLALVLAGLSALDRERPRISGVLFGIAAVLKLLPGIFLLWLLLKRRWWAAVACAATIATLALVPPALVFGTQRALEYHREWFAYNVRGDAVSGMLRTDLPEHFIDRRNESIAQVLARWTWPQHPYRLGWQPVQLDPQTCKQLADGISGVLLVALLWSTRRRWPQLSIGRRHAEAAAYAIAMLALSPLVRQYYLVWGLPGLVVLAQEAVASSDKANASAGRTIGRIGLTVWFIGMVLWVWPTPRVWGAHLVMLIVLGVFLLLRRAGDSRATRPLADEPA